MERNDSCHCWWRSRRSLLRVFSSTAVHHQQQVSFLIVWHCHLGVYRLSRLLLLRDSAAPTHQLVDQRILGVHFQQ